MIPNPTLFMEPNHEKFTTELFGDLWDKYDDKEFMKSVSLFERRFKENNFDLSYFKGKMCLDAGCGGGRYSIALSILGSQEVYGVDISWTGLQDAKKRGQSLGINNIYFNVGSVLSLPFADASFDFICCSGVIHHTPDPELAFREVFRCLKPRDSVFPHLCNWWTLLAHSVSDSKRFITNRI